MSRFVSSYMLNRFEIVDQLELLANLLEQIRQTHWR